MEIEIINTGKYEVSVGLTYHLDLWTLLSISWWRYNHIDITHLSADEVPKILNVPRNPNIIGGSKCKCTRKCFTVNIDILCFRFFVECWKWLSQNEMRRSVEKYNGKN